MGQEASSPPLSPYCLCSAAAPGGGVITQRSEIRPRATKAAGPFSIAAGSVALPLLFRTAGV